MARKKVLIADDDCQLAEALATRVLQLGIDVCAVHDALSAVTIAHDDAPDLVILDVNMPAGNGLSVCEMLASDPASSKIPVIILTGRKDPETIRRCHDMLAYYVLKSPNVWTRIEPIMSKLLDIAPTPRIASIAGKS